MNEAELDRRRALQVYLEHAERLNSLPIERCVIVNRKEFVESQLLYWRDLIKAAPEKERLDVELKILELEMETSRLQYQLQGLDRAPPIDRKGLARAWEETLEHGDISVRLLASNISPRTYRGWRDRTKCRRDDSPCAIKIVGLLAGDLRAAGIDVGRFGVR
jgi:hypothetical protein